MKTYRVYVQIECHDPDAEEEYSKVPDECVLTTASLQEASRLCDSLIEAANSYNLPLSRCYRDALKEEAVEWIKSALRAAGIQVPEKPIIKKGGE